MDLLIVIPIVVGSVVVTWLLTSRLAGRHQPDSTELATAPPPLEEFQVPSPQPSAVSLWNANTAADDIVERARATAAQVLVSAMEKLATQPPVDALSTFVPVASEDVKGRIIGREGKNIRAFEHATGVDLLVDEHPGGIVLSSFSAHRREVARVALLALMEDGRIQPTKIEEAVQKAESSVLSANLDAARSAGHQLGLEPLPKRANEALGELRLQTSVGQNLLAHSLEVGQLAAQLATELGFDAKVAALAGLLHDIGKAASLKSDQPHALVGQAFVKQVGLPDSIGHAVGAHHYDITPESPEALLVIVADAVSAARPGARSEPLAASLQRLEALEALIQAFDGVQAVHVLQQGRALRVLVRPESVEESALDDLASRIAERVRAETGGGAPIQMTLIRETRVQRQIGS